jgi:WD40 repeat protein
MRRSKTWAMGVAVSVVAFAVAAVARQPVRTAPADDKPRSDTPGTKQPRADAWGPVRSFGKADGNVYAISPDGTEVVIRPFANRLTVLNLRTGKTRPVPGKFGGHFGSIAYSPDGKLVACAEWQEGATIRDAKTWAVIERFTPGKYPVSTASFLPDGKRIAFYCWQSAWWPRPLDLDKPLKHHDYQLVLWDVENKKALGWPAGERIDLPTVHFHEGAFVGRPYLCVREDRSDAKGYSASKTFSMTDMATNKTTPRIALDKDDDRVFDVTPDGKQILVMTAGKDPRLVDVETGKSGRSFGGHVRLVTVAALSRDGKRVVTASAKQVDGFTAAKLKDGWPANVGPTEIRIHDAATGELIAGYEDDNLADFEYVGFSPDGKYVWAETAGKELWLWGQFPAPPAGVVVNWPVDPKDPAAIRSGGPKPPAGASLVADALDKLAEELPKSGRTAAQQIDALFLAALGRLPTAAEVKKVGAKFGENPTAERLRAIVAELVASPEFEAHVKTLDKRMPAKTPIPYKWDGRFPTAPSPFGWPPGQPNDTPPTPKKP